MKRTFIAIKIPVTKNISDIYQNVKLELKNEKIKWVEEWNLHITVAFLGDTEENDIENICDKFSEYLEGFNHFLLMVTGLGVFKNVNNPKTLWLGIEKSEDIKRLNNKIVEVMRSLGFNIQNKDFRPHITIGRTKFIKNRSDLKDLTERYNETEIDQLKIDEVYFYESNLTSKGPVYKVLRKFNLI